MHNVSKAHAIDAAAACGTSPYKVIPACAASVPTAIPCSIQTGFMHVLHSLRSAMNHNGASNRRVSVRRALAMTIHMERLSQSPEISIVDRKTFAPRCAGKLKKPFASCFSGPARMSLQAPIAGAKRSQTVDDCCIAEKLAQALL